jgi:hypothetical protein
MERAVLALIGGHSAASAVLVDAEVADGDRKVTGGWFCAADPTRTATSSGKSGRTKVGDTSSLTDAGCRRAQDQQFRAIWQPWRVLG